MGEMTALDSGEIVTEQESARATSESVATIRAVELAAFSLDALSRSSAGRDC